MDTRFLSRAAAAATAAAVAAMLSGCGTVSVPVTMDVPGEFRLSGVSKIALLDFNTLPDDPFAGVAAVDDDTRALVRRAVAAAFYETPTFAIADLAAERQVSAAEALEGLADKRYDAVIAGSAWWQQTEETDGVEPKVFDLRSWKVVHYKTKIKNPFTGETVEKDATAEVTTRTDQSLEMVPYRERHASLMLALSIYRVGENGLVEKVVDTYQATDKGFVVANGAFFAPEETFGPERRDAVSKHLAPEKPKKEGGSWGAFGTQLLGEVVSAGQKIAAGAEKTIGGSAAGADDSTASPGSGRDATGKAVLPQRLVAMPTDLQARLVLAAKLSKDLSARIAPSKATLDVPYDFDDAKLAALLRDGAYDAAEKYAVRAAREALGAEYAANVETLVAAGPASYAVPPTSEDDRKAVEHKKRGFQRDKFVELLLDRKIDQYLFGIGLCQEATGRADSAFAAYREAFDLAPDQSPAQGMARCRIALGSADRVKEQRKEAKKADRRAAL